MFRLNGSASWTTELGWPGIKVLHTSGYTDNSIANRGKINKGVDLLRKPYRKSTLARKVREVLDGGD